jgi:predicted transposase YdaD
MPYITSVEQIGYDRGFKIGAERGEKRGEENGAYRQARSLILRQLDRKIGIIPNDIIKRIDTFSIVQLESLSEALFDFESIADLTIWLNNQITNDRNAL